MFSTLHIVVREGLYTTMEKDQLPECSGWGHKKRNRQEESGINEDTPDNEHPNKKRIVSIFPE